MHRIDEKLQITILIVDDDAPLRAGTVRLLRQAGYDVLEAADGAEGLRLTRAARPAILLLDVMLPDVNGAALCRRIKADPDLRDTYIALLSGLKTSSDDRADGIEEGADDYLTRPISNRELLARIKAMERIIKTESVLRASEAKYRTLFQNMNNGFILLEAVRDAARQVVDFRYLEINQATQTMMGLPPEEMVGKTIFEVLGENAHLPTFELYRRVLASGVGATIEFLSPFLGKHLEMFIFRAEDERIGVIYTDVTERKRAEEALQQHQEHLEELVKERTAALEQQNIERLQIEVALRESELKYRNIVDHSTSIILEWDPDGNILFLNQYGLEYFGFEPEEILGRNVLGTIVAPVDSTGYNLRLKMQNVQQAPEDYYSSENENLRRNGEKVWVAWTNKGIRAEDGRLIKILSFGIDRTKQKLLEGEVEYLQELRAINQRLEREIYQRKKSEGALRESEERFRLAMEAAQDGLWDWNIAGGAVYYSPAYWEMLGYVPAEQPPTAQAWMDLIHPDDREAALLANREGIEGRRDSFVIEFRMRTRSGEWRWIQGRGKTVARDAGGRALRMIGTHTDITGRKQAEEALKKSEEKFRLLAEKSVVGIYILQDGKIVYANPGMAKIFGYAPEEIIATLSLKDLIHPEDFQTVMRRYQERLAGAVESSNIVYKAVKKDGALIFIEVYGMAIEYLDRPAVMGTLIDVTERKQAEKALQESEERFRSLYENTAIGIYRTTPEGRILMANPALVRMLGYQTFEELAQRDLTTAGFEPGYSRREFQRRIEQDGTVIGLESSWIRQDGATIAVRESARLVTDECGQPRYYDGTAEDITDRKRAEEQIKQALREKETLLRELYHRTKNNMQVIRSMLQLRAATSQNGEIAAFVREIDQKILSMALVHQKLYQAQDLSWIRLDDYVAELAALTVQSEQNPSANIGLRLELESVRVLLDTATPCGLVVHELISNALKHAFPDARAGEIRIRLRRAPDEAIELDVADNGIGMPAGLDLDAQPTLGLQTVVALVKHQMQGDIQMNGQRGLAYFIRFKDNLYTARV